MLGSDVKEHDTGPGLLLTVSVSAVIRRQAFCMRTWIAIGPFHAASERDYWADRFQSLLEEKSRREGGIEFNSHRLIVEVIAKTRVKVDERLRCNLRVERVVTPEKLLDSLDTILLRPFQQLLDGTLEAVK